MDTPKSIKPGEIDTIPARYGIDYLNGGWYPYKIRKHRRKVYLSASKKQPMRCLSEDDAIATIYIIGEGAR